MSTKRDRLHQLIHPNELGDTGIDESVDHAPRPEIVRFLGPTIYQVGFVRNSTIEMIQRSFLEVDAFAPLSLEVFNDTTWQEGDLQTQQVGAYRLRIVHSNLTRFGFWYNPFYYRAYHEITAQYAPSDGTPPKPIQSQKILRHFLTSLPKNPRSRSRTLRMLSLAIPEDQSQAAVSDAHAQSFKTPINQDFVDFEARLMKDAEKKAIIERQRAGMQALRTRQIRQAHKQIKRDLYRERLKENALPDQGQAADVVHQPEDLTP